MMSATEMHACKPDTPMHAHTERIIPKQSERINRSRVAWIIDHRRTLMSSAKIRPFGLGLNSTFLAMP